MCYTVIIWTLILLILGNNSVTLLFHWLKPVHCILTDKINASICIRIRRILEVKICIQRIRILTSFVTSPVIGLHNTVQNSSHDGLHAYPLDTHYRSDDAHWMKAEFTFKNNWQKIFISVFNAVCITWIDVCMHDIRVCSKQRPSLKSHKHISLCKHTILLSAQILLAYLYCGGQVQLS